MKKENIFKNTIIVILAIAVIVLSILLYNSYKKNSVKNSNISGIYTQIKGINTKKASKNLSFPEQDPITVMQYIINNYKNCIESSNCPISENFRERASQYIKNGGKLNPITRLIGPYTNPSYSIITELPSISIIKVSGENSSDIQEFDLSNINNKWILTNSYCFNNPNSGITNRSISTCN
jgi:hypothetical protein